MKKIIFIFAMSISLTSIGQKMDYVALSQQLLETARQNKPSKDIQQQLAEVSLNDLNVDLDTDTKRKAFWINIYNAYVQIILTDAPEKFEDRGAFFSGAQIKLVGRELSFDDIEHGIIRGSQSKYALGFIPKWFVNDFERKLRVRERDGRIHFALNCGAKSCPPIPILSTDRLEEQLDAASRSYLQATTTYDAPTKTAGVTALFSWFRGDFGNLSGVREYLHRYEAIPKTADPSLSFNDYDWTLDLGNYIDL